MLKKALNNAPKKKQKADKPKILRPPRSLGVAMGNSIPITHLTSLKPSPDASVRYTGCDYVGKISSLTTTLIGAYQPIQNPNLTLFPRLSNIADLFLKYRFRKLVWHIIGESASTQAGSAAFSSQVTDGLGGDPAYSTDSIIRNSEGVLTLRGWEAGRHEIKVSASGLKWLAVDTDAGLDTIGARLGYLIQSIPATTSNGLLVFSSYIEYDVEFTEAYAAEGVDLSVRRLKRQLKGAQSQRNPTQPSTTGDKLAQLLDNWGQE